MTGGATAADVVVAGSAVVVSALEELKDVAKVVRLDSVAAEVVSTTVAALDSVLVSARLVSEVLSAKVEVEAMRVVEGAKEVDSTDEDSALEITVVVCEGVT